MVTPETLRLVAVIKPTVVTPEVLTLSWFNVPTDVREEPVIPVPKVVELRTVLVPIL